MATMSTPSLTPTSYLVLGLVARFQPVTSYDLKQVVQRSVGNFWSFPHSQLYAEPARLVNLGLLAEERELAGRRRRRFRLTAEGRIALRTWLATPAVERVEVRDTGLLQYAIADPSEGDDIAALARGHLASHRAKQKEYQHVRATLGDRADPEISTLRMGELYEQAAITFWTEVLQAQPGDDDASRHSGAAPAWSDGPRPAT
jgi:PadR family transcriptional regulator, regulatory protein AphA